jgi:hypothetical protein
MLMTKVEIGNLRNDDVIAKKMGGMVFHIPPKA